MKAMRYMVFIASGLALSACQKNETAPSATTSPASSQTVSTVQTASQVNSAINPTHLASSAATSPVASQVSVSHIDLSNAHDINQDSDLNYLTSLFIAQTTRTLSDEAKLEKLSDEYRNEADTFKKRALATTLMPKLQQQVEKYKGTYIAKVPIINDEITANRFLAQQKDKNLSVLSTSAFGLQTITPYNFDTKTFAMSCQLDKFLSHGKYGGLGKFFENNQSITLDFLRASNDSGQYVVAPPKEKCELLVADENVAKKIEAARANHRLGSQGELYVQLTADDNELKARPLQATINYLDMQTDEILATKTFHW